MQTATDKVQEKEVYLSAYRALEARTADAGPAWLASLRNKAIRRFDELGFPTTRDEEWKYTNVAPIVRAAFRPGAPPRLSELDVVRFFLPEACGSRLVFVNGYFAPELSNTSALPAGVSVGNFAEADKTTLRDHLAAYAEYHDAAFTALNTAFISDGALIHIPAGKVVEPAIHLLFISTAREAFVSHPRTLILAERGSVATVFESYVAVDDGVYFTNAVTEVLTEQGAHLTHYRLQQECEQAFHVAATDVRQECDSHYTSYAISLGAELARHTLNVKLTGAHIETTLDGLYVANGRQHLDNHTTLDHAAPHSASHQLYKGILDDRARAVFNGKVFVRKGALRTDAKQLNKNILLSPTAHVDTKPQLEIYADDVKCTHGATVGQLEEDEVFYLKSRGLSAETARALLTYGFAEDIISRIKLPSVHRLLDAAVLAKLHQNLEVK